MLPRLNLTRSHIGLAIFVSSMDFVVLRPPLFCPSETRKNTVPALHLPFLAQFTRTVKKV
jgi:hypothetical protein